MLHDVGRGADGLPDADARELGFWVCTALIVGNTIGIGIFMVGNALRMFNVHPIFRFFAIGQALQRG